VIRIAPNVAGVSEGADQRNAAVEAGGDAQQMVVGEERDDDVAGLCQSVDRSKIRPKLRRPPLLDETRHGPRAPAETAFEISATDEEQLGVDS
jgi:hypothetical protein